MSQQRQQEHTVAVPVSILIDGAEESVTMKKFLNSWLINNIAFTQSKMVESERRIDDQDKVIERIRQEITETEFNPQ